MRQFKSERRLQKIERVVRSRQPDLRIVLENIHDPHNVSAIFRSCDATGVPKISLIYNSETFPKISSVSSSSANKWVEVERFGKTEDCFKSLRLEGFKILTTTLNDHSKSIYEIDFTEKVAIVMGNEHRGSSDEAIELADETIYIPMHGMIQSLNVSVATAVILYEAQRQRLEKMLYENSMNSEENIQKTIDEWCDK